MTIQNEQIQVKIIESSLDMQASRCIREIVFIQEQEVPADIEYDEFESSATHILATMNGGAVGTARWRHTAKGHKLERFAVLRSARGQGVGEALVKFVLDQIDLAEPAYLNSQLVALEFYKKLGFVAEGEVFYEANIPHRTMYFSP